MGSGDVQAFAQHGWEALRGTCMGFPVSHLVCIARTLQQGHSGHETEGCISVSTKRTFLDHECQEAHCGLAPY